MKNKFFLVITGLFFISFFTVLFIGLIIACFVPSLQPYISDGFRFLREDCPDWLSYGILASIAASFGLKSIGKFRK